MILEIHINYEVTTTHDVQCQNRISKVEPNHRNISVTSDRRIVLTSRALLLECILSPFDRRAEYNKKKITFEQRELPIIGCPFQP